MNYPHHPEEGMVYACPECDLATIYHRVGTDDYRCSRCGATFDEPDERQGRRGRYSGENILSDDDLLDDVRRVCEAFGRGVSVGEYGEHGEHDPSTISRRIGFPNAVREVGFEPVSFVPKPDNGGRKEGSTGGPRSELGRKLMDMDPEDLGLSPMGKRAD